MDLYLQTLFGTGGSGTSITLTSTVGFPTTGTNFIKVDDEEISYTGVSGNDLTGITRNVRGTTNASHSNGATVTNFSDFSGWGQAATNTDFEITHLYYILNEYGMKDGKYT